MISMPSQQVDVTSYVKSLERFARLLISDHLSGGRTCCARTYTQLLIAEAKGKMAHDFRVFFMGRKGSMEARYTTKGVLPEVPVAEMRQSFGRSEEHLDQSEAADPLMEQRERAQQMIAEVTPEQIGKTVSGGKPYGKVTS